MKIALFMTPIAFLYLATFRTILSMKATIDRKYTGRDKEASIIASTEEGTGEDNKELRGRIEDMEAKVNDSLTWDGIRSIMQTVGPPILNMAIVISTLSRCTSSNTAAQHPLQREPT